jgi:hypothetical protein
MSILCKRRATVDPDVNDTISMSKRKRTRRILLDDQASQTLEITNVTDFIFNRSILRGVLIPGVPTDLPVFAPSPPAGSNFKVICAHDMVAGFVGQTGLKMKALLEECRGKVVFIDEAYKLHDSRVGAGDFLGLALTMLIEWMDKHRDETIFIFAGYEDKLKQTIFAIQPGLQRRLQWVFKFKPYTTKELFAIFEIKLQKTKIKWAIDSPLKAFEEFSKTYPNGGGDMERLLFRCSILVKVAYFDANPPPTRDSGLEITSDILKKAIDNLNSATMNDSISMDILCSLYS